MAKEGGCKWCSLTVLPVVVVVEEAATGRWMSEKVKAMEFCPCRPTCRIYRRDANLLSPE